MEFSFVDISNPTNHNEVNIMQPVGVVISKDSMYKARDAYSKNTIKFIENYTPSATPTPTPTPSYTPYAECYAAVDNYISTSTGKDYAAKGSDKYVYATTEYATTGYSSSYAEPREYVNTDDKGGYSKSGKSTQEYAVAVEGKGYSSTYGGSEYVISY